MLYRYEFESGCEYPHTGFLCGLDELFEEFNDNLFKAIGFFEDNLDCPGECFYDKTLPRLVCYFTEKGNKKFRKSIKNIKEEVNKININMIKLTLDESIIDKIYYEDKYQVVIDVKYIEKSNIMKS